MIEVIHYEPANKNKVIGYVDVKVCVNGLVMIIRKIAHLQSGDRKWFNLPTFSKEREDGSHQYFKYWQFEMEPHNNQLMEALSEKVKEYCLEHNIKEIEPLQFHQAPLTMDELPF